MVRHGSSGLNYLPRSVERTYIENLFGELGGEEISYEDYDEEKFKRGKNQTPRKYNKKRKTNN